MYIDNRGIEHESYTAACIYYGADTPETLAYEAASMEADEAIATQDWMEANGGPLPYRAPVSVDPWDDMPF